MTGTAAQNAGKIVPEEKKDSAAGKSRTLQSISGIGKSILSVLLTVFLIAATILCVVVAVNNAKGNDNFFGYSIYYVVSGSMEPTIHTGAAIVVKENESGIYEVGDIVTFTSSNAEIYGKPNTHRIIGVTDVDGTRVYTTKGDANSIPDAESITAADIRGKLMWNTGSLKWIATLMGVITTPMGFVSMIILPILLITVNQMKDFTKEFKEAAANAAAENIAQAGGGQPGGIRTAEAETAQSCQSGREIRTASAEQPIKPEQKILSEQLIRPAQTEQETGDPLEEDTR